MKPLLRAVLVINGLIFLGFGVLFLLTPWVALFDSMNLAHVQPAAIGQLLGIALIGLAWLEFHAAFDGAFTATAAKVTGHVEWLSGLVMMVWVLWLRRADVSGFGQLVAVLVGVGLLVLGLGSVRLASAVRRRERAVAAGALSAERAEQRAAKARADERTTPPTMNPVPPVTTTSPTTRWNDEPVAGAPVPPLAPRPAAPAPRATGFDPVTGHVVEPVIDPLTGRAIEPVVTGHKIDPETGRAIDPMTGRVVEPGYVPVDPLRRDPR